MSPVIVVPGKWSIAELRYQAEHVATMLVNNAGFNCISARVVVTHAAWPQRDAFLGALTQTLAEITTRRAYYPGPSNGAMPSWRPIPRPRSSAAGPTTRCPGPSSRACRPGAPTTSASTWSPSVGEVAETALPAPSTAAFIDAATAFCNDVLWGTLGATIIVSPASTKDQRRGGRARACRRGPALRLHRGQPLARPCPSPWGRRPGAPTRGIRAPTSSPGTGVVGNALMFDRPQKSVVRGPFRSRPKPPWFATAKDSYDVMRRFVAFEAEPSAAKIPGLLLAAMRT